MHDNYAILKFKKFLDSISIDIWFRLVGEEFIEEYYSVEKKPDEFYSAIIDDDGFSDGEPGYRTGEPIWAFGFNKQTDKKFFEKYTELEKNLIEERTLNFKIVKEFEEFDSLYKDLTDWINEKVEGIRHEQKEDLFKCDYSQPCILFEKITFRSKYDNDIQNFFKELRNRLMQTYSLLKESTPTLTFNPSLKWDKSKVDLVELLAALVESKSVLKDTDPVTKEYLFEFFSHIFPELDLTNFAKDLNQAKRRKKDKARYLKFLAKTFEDFASKKSKTSK
jgi:hypothetical protein